MMNVFEFSKDNTVNLTIARIYLYQLISIWLCTPFIWYVVFHLCYIACIIISSKHGFLTQL